MKKLIVMLLIAVVAGSCSDTENFEELTIEREPRVIPRGESSSGWEKLENGLFKATFRVPTSFLTGSVFPLPATADPFADPVEALSQNKRVTAQEIFEQAGVRSSKGTYATYDSIKSLVTVVQTEDQLELVELFVASIRYCPPKQIIIRAEIYELPDFTALKILESSAGHNDHSPEREAVLKAVKNGMAQLIASPQIIARSGQRAKVESVVREYYDLGLHDESEDKEEEQSNELVDVGTILETDPVLGADNLTIDLNISLTHDTADPTPATQVGKLPRFHQKKIITQITTKDGNYILIGDWKPTGEPSHQGKTHLIFITASVQTSGAE